MMKADALAALQEAKRAIEAAITMVERSTEDQVPSGNVRYRTANGHVTILTNRRVNFDPEQSELTTDEVMRKGISYWAEPSGAVCRCCNGSGRQ